VHSSTSAFEPRAAWPKVVLLASLFTMLGAAALELLWARQGFAPSLADSPGLWADVRARAQVGGKNDVALVGSSRFQLGLDPAVMAGAAPGRRFHQLSVRAGEPLFLLESLARDRAFAGTVLFEIHPGRLTQVFGEAEVRSEAFVGAYVERPWIDRIEQPLARWFERRLRLVGDQANVKSVIKSLLETKTLPRGNGSWLRDDRFVVTRYDAAWAKIASARRARGMLAFELASPAVVEQRIEQLARSVEMIRARGGEVIFFRINACDEVLALEESRAPRAVIYEPLRARIGGKWLHFEDDPILRNIPCGDGSHVLGEHTAVLSRRVAELLFSDAPEETAEIHTP
jgi:hypothetical protein